MVLLDCFWALGACLEVLLATMVMSSGGWRWLLGLSSLPAVALAVACCVWLPESARFQSARGHSDRAMDTLERIAKANNKPMLLGR